MPGFIMELVKKNLNSIDRKLERSQQCDVVTRNTVKRITEIETCLEKGILKSPRN